jgi:hypothetical protein
MSEQAPVVVEIRILDLPELQSLINLVTVSMETMALCLKNTQDEAARLRAQIAPAPSTPQSIEERLDACLAEIVAACRRHNVKIDTFVHRKGITLYPEDCTPWATYPHEAIRVGGICPDGAFGPDGSLAPAREFRKQKAGQE